MSIQFIQGNQNLMFTVGGMAQGHVDDGGSSSVVLYVKAFCYLSIAVWACSLKNKNISRSDTYTFIGALFAIPIWLITKNPLAALCVIMVIDVLSFFPTIRKTYDEPCSENLTAYMLSGSSYIFMMLAVANPTFETLFYPIFLTTLELGFVLFVLIVRALKTSMPQKQGICTADI
jgi:hypothetical protein